MRNKNNNKSEEDDKKKKKSKLISREYTYDESLRRSRTYCGQATLLWSSRSPRCHSPSSLPRRPAPASSPPHGATDTRTWHEQQQGEAGKREAVTTVPRKVSRRGTKGGRERSRCNFYPRRRRKDRSSLALALALPIRYSHHGLAYRGGPKTSPLLDVLRDLLPKGILVNTNLQLPYI